MSTTPKPIQEATSQPVIVEGPCLALVPPPSLAVEPPKARSTWADDDLLTLKEAAAYTRYAPKTLYNYKSRGLVKADNGRGTRSGKVLFKKSDLDKFLRGKGGQ